MAKNNIQRFPERDALRTPLRTPPTGRVVGHTEGIRAEAPRGRRNGGGLGTARSRDAGGRTAPRVKAGKRVQLQDKKAHI